MRSMLAGRARLYLTDAARAFERAPVEVTVAVCLAIAFSVAIEMGGDAFRAWTELAVAGALIVAAAWTGTLLHTLWGGGSTALRRRWIITGGGAVVIALYALFVLDFERDAEAWRALMIVGAAVLWIVAAPVLAGPIGTAVDRVRTVAGRLLLRTLGALLYCAALYAGLALALAAINTLFELNLSGNIYAHVFGWIFLVLAPWIVVGGLPEYAQPVEPRAEVAGVVHRMTAFLVPPLLILYYGILYAYAVRIAVTGEVPKNLVSPMVLTAGLLAAAGLFLFDPHPRSGSSTQFRSLRAAPPLFLPLAALGIWAITLRVSQYGWTEFRLLRLLLLGVLAALALGATLQLIRRQRFALHIAPLLAAGVLLLAAVGPWSILAVSRHSQQARLTRALEAVGVDASVTTPATSVAWPDDVEARPVPAEAYDDISSTARYLASHHGRQALPPLLAAQVGGDRDIHDLAGGIGLRREAPATSPDRGMGAQFGAGMTIELEGFTVRRVMTTPSRGPGPTTDGGVVAVQDSLRLRMRVGDEVFVADLATLVASLAVEPDHRPTVLRPDAAGLDVTDGDGRHRGSLLVLDIWLNSVAGVIRLERLDGLLLLSP